MKKQLKTTVMAIALLATVTGAFASDIVNAISGKKLVNYEWQQLDKNGVVIDSRITTSSSNPYPACSGSQELCSRGRVQGTTPYTFTYRYPTP